MEKYFEFKFWKEATRKTIEWYEQIKKENEDV